MREAFDRRRQAIVNMLNGIDGVTCPTPTGAFYAYPSLTGLLNRPLGGRAATTTLELADLILEVINVAFVPGEAFGTPGYGRVQLRARAMTTSPKASAVSPTWSRADRSP